MNLRLCIINLNILKRLKFTIENNIDNKLLQIFSNNSKNYFKQQDNFLNNLLKQKDSLKIDKDKELDDYQDIFNQYIDKEDMINNSQKKVIKLSNKKIKK